MPINLKGIKVNRNNPVINQGSDMPNKRKTAEELAPSNTYQFEFMRPTLIRIE